MVQPVSKPFVNSVANLWCSGWAHNNADHDISSPPRFYMKYAPDENGNFSGQGGYGYVSFEKFIDAVADLNQGKVSLEDLEKRDLPSLKNTIATGAILEAGRRSLDEGRPIDIVEENGQWLLK